MRQGAGHDAETTRIYVAVLFVVLAAWLPGTAAAQTNITFLDTNLEAVVRSTIAKPSGPLSSVDLQALLSLSAPYQNIENLSGLEWATNLSVLDLTGNSITNINPLQALKRLTDLVLAPNRVSDLSPVIGLSNLISLDLSWNPVTNCASLSGVTNLTSLYLRGNSVDNPGFVQNLNRLAFLNLGE